MLELIDISKAINEIITFDFYVPINIEFEKWEAKEERYLYWRTGKFLEIGINPKNKAISSLTLVHASTIHFQNKQFHVQKKLLGLPLFKTNQWENDIYYLDDTRDKDFEIYVGENNLVILLEPNKIITLNIINGRVVFGFDKNNFLCSIEVTNITSEEMAVLKESLTAMAKM